MSSPDFGSRFRRGPTANSVPESIREALVAGSRRYLATQVWPASVTLGDVESGRRYVRNHASDDRTILLIDWLWWYSRITLAARAIHRVQLHATDSTSKNLLTVEPSFDTTYAFIVDHFQIDHLGALGKMLDSTPLEHVGGSMTLRDAIYTAAINILYKKALAIYSSRSPLTHQYVFDIAHTPLTKTVRGDPSTNVLERQLRNFDPRHESGASLETWLGTLLQAHEILAADADLFGLRQRGGFRSVSYDALSSDHPNQLPSEPPASLRLDVLGTRAQVPSEFGTRQGRSGLRRLRSRRKPSSSDGVERPP